MAHHEEGARPLGQEILEPQDPLDVQVVGGLVHQEDVGRRRQLARDGEPLLPASRQGVDGRAAVGEPGTAERVREATGPVFLVVSGQRGDHHLVDRSTGGKHGVLGDIPDTNAVAERAGAAIGRGVAGENLQERGLARAIGTDETGLVAFEQSKRQTVEERPGSVGLADGLTAEQERAGHPPSLLLLLRLLLFLPHACTFRHGLTPSRRALPRSALS